MSNTKLASTLQTSKALYIINPEGTHIAEVKQLDLAWCMGMAVDAIKDAGFTMLTSHKKHTNLGTEQFKPTDKEYASARSWEDIQKILEKKYDKSKTGNLLIKPVYMMDHGGLSFSTKPFQGDIGRFDSSQVGFIYQENFLKDYKKSEVGKSDIKKSVGEYHLAMKKAQEATLSLMDDKIKEYSDLMNGQASSITIFKTQPTIDLSHFISGDECQQQCDWDYFVEDYKLPITDKKELKEFFMDEVEKSIHGQKKDIAFVELNLFGKPYIPGQPYILTMPHLRQPFGYIVHPSGEYVTKFFEDENSRVFNPLTHVTVSKSHSKLDVENMHKRGGVWHVIDAQVKDYEDAIIAKFDVKSTDIKELTKSSMEKMDKAYIEHQNEVTKIDKKVKKISKTKTRDIEPEL